LNILNAISEKKPLNPYTTPIIVGLMKPGVKDAMQAFTLLEHGQIFKVN
jgi:hypothetical protein